MPSHEKSEIAARSTGGTVMTWEAPTYVEVNMNAEINAYQDDFEHVPDVGDRPAHEPAARPSN